MVQIKVYSSKQVDLNLSKIFRSLGVISVVHVPHLCSSISVSRVGGRTNVRMAMSVCHSRPVCVHRTQGLSIPKLIQSVPLDSLKKG
jgi:hypothetical protein